MEQRTNESAVMQHIADTIRIVTDATDYPDNTVPATTFNQVSVDILVLGLASFEKSSKIDLGIKRAWLLKDGMGHGYQTLCDNRGRGKSQTAMIAETIAAALDMTGVTDRHLKDGIMSNMSFTITAAYENPVIFVWFDKKTYLGIEFCPARYMEVAATSFSPESPFEIAPSKPAVYRRFLSSDMYLQPNVSDRAGYTSFLMALEKLHDEATDKDENAIKDFVAQVDALQHSCKLLISACTAVPEVFFENDDVAYLGTAIMLVIDISTNSGAPKPRAVIRMGTKRKVLDSGAQKPWSIYRNRIITPEDVGVRPVEKPAETMTRVLTSLNQTDVTFKTNSYIVFTHSMRIIMDTHTKGTFDQIMATAAYAVAESLVKEGQFDRAVFGMDVNRVGAVGLLIYSKEGKAYDFNFV